MCCFDVHQLIFAISSVIFAPMIVNVFTIMGGRSPQLGGGAVPEGNSCETAGFSAPFFDFWLIGASLDIFIIVGISTRYGRGRLLR